MKKVLIIGSDFPIGAQITKAMFDKKTGITIITPEEARDISENEYFKKEALKLSCLKDNNVEQPIIFDKPKSKYHK